MKRTRPGGRLASFPGLLGPGRDRVLQLSLPIGNEQACTHVGEPLDPDAPRQLGECVNVSWRCRLCNVVALEESWTLEAWTRQAGRPLKDPRR